MTKIILLLFLVTGQLSFGQTKSPTKSALLKALDKSILQNEKGKIIVDSNPWIACNTDSAFYRLDTIKFYNNDKYQSLSNCCDFIDWTFYKKDAFVLTRAKFCKEPPTTSVAKEKDWFKIHVSKINTELVMAISDKDSVIDQFKVLSINKEMKKGQGNTTANVLVLVRLKQVSK